MQIETVAVTSEARSKPDYAVLAKREFESFLHLTAFKSLQFVKHSVHWTESIFWILLIASATTLAVNDVRKVFDEYLGEETYTRMSVIGLQMLSFDDAVICVEYDPRALNLADPQLLLHANTSEIFDLAKRANTSEVELLSRSLKLFTVVSLIENGRPADYAHKVLDILQSDDVQQFQDWLKAQNVNIFDLGSTVGNWLCNVAQIRIDTLKHGALFSSTNPCAKERITWLGVIPFVDISMSETAVCVDVSKRISFESMDRIVVSLDTRELFRKLPSAKKTNDYILNSFLDFSGDPVSTDMTRDFLQFPSNGCAAYEIGVDAEMRLLDRKVARCNATAKSRLACLAGCAVIRYEFADLCTCTQLAWRYLYTSYRTMCFDTQSIQQHLDCRQEAHRTNVSDDCLKSCLFPCKHRQHVSSVVEGGCNEESRGDGVSLQLTPKRFMVPVFEEQFSVGVSELFSRLGGTCGLWLGVGMFGICHAILFPLKLLMRFGLEGGHMDVVGMELK